VKESVALALPAWHIVTAAAAAIHRSRSPEQHW
jgi:hypothetical protein